MEAVLPSGTKRGVIRPITLSSMTAPHASLIIGLNSALAIFNLAMNAKPVLCIFCIISPILDVLD